MVRIAALVAALTLACSLTPPTDVSEVPPGMPFVLSREEAPQRLLFSATPETAGDALAAVELWHDASEGAYDPEVLVSEDCDPTATRCFSVVPEITDCPSQPTGKHILGCTYPKADRRIVVAETTEEDVRVSILAHELGHTLFLPHTDDPDDLMNPSRSHEIRIHPCISATDVTAAGFSGPGACVDE